MCACMFCTYIKSACMCVHYKGIAKAGNRAVVTGDSLMPLHAWFSFMLIGLNTADGRVEREREGCIGDQECEEKTVN